MQKILKKILLIFPVMIAVICISGCADRKAETKVVIAKFGEEDIYLEEVQFYLIINQVAYERKYAEKYPGENIWQKDILETGNFLEEDVKQSIMQELKKMHMLLKKAEELGITMEKEDEEELIVLEEIFKAKYSEDVLSEIHTEDGVLQERLRQSMLAAKVQEVISEENGWAAEDREERWNTLYKKWAEEISFTIREAVWSEIHFEQGKYTLAENKQKINEEIPE